MKRGVAKPHVGPIRPGPPMRQRPTLFRRLVVGAVTLIVVTALPFLIMVRGSLYLYSRNWSTLPAVAAPALIAIGVTAVYAAALSQWLSGRARFIAMVRWVALPLVIGWTVYALFYLARVNAKTAEVRSTYGKVHPILRMALSTVILVDPGLVVTDMKRVPADYDRMGLPAFDRTLHYAQADGWVHAVDLRTNNHGELKNRAVQAYFWTMGFGTLRHVGTADHLHVELPIPR
jgi:hypothetical protein